MVEPSKLFITKLTAAIISSSSSASSFKAEFHWLPRDVRDKPVTSPTSRWFARDVADFFVSCRYGQVKRAGCRLIAVIFQTHIEFLSTCRNGFKTPKFPRDTCGSKSCSVPNPDTSRIWNWSHWYKEPSWRRAGSRYAPGGTELALASSYHCGRRYSSGRLLCGRLHAGWNERGLFITTGRERERNYTTVGLQTACLDKYNYSLSFRVCLTLELVSSRHRRRSSVIRGGAQIVCPKMY